MYVHKQTVGIEHYPTLSQIGLTHGTQCMHVHRQTVGIEHYPTLSQIG